MPSPSPTIGVVIVAFESDAVLPEALAALGAASDRAPIAQLEVVVVDNGSSRKLRLSGAGRPPARLMRLESNLGFSPAVNIAARHLQGTDYLLLLNPDARLEPDAVANLLDAFTDPQVAIAAPALVDSAGRLLPCERPFYTVPVELLRQFAPFAARRRIAGRRAWAGGEARRVSGACLLVERAFFDACGGLDEAIRMYLEDVELCWQARARGRRVRLVPSARCVHTPGQSSGGANETTSLGLYLTLLASRVEFVRRRQGARAALAMRGLMTVGALLRLVARPGRRNREKQLAVIRWALLDGAAPPWESGPVVG